MATARKKKFVMVGCKTLSADIVKHGDPIEYGEIVEVSGLGLKYAETKTYKDTLGNVHNMFVDPESQIGKRILGTDEEEEAPKVRRRRRA